MTTPIRTLFSVSVFFMIFGVSLGILALVADMLKTIKTEQDEILYKLKKAEIDKKSWTTNGKIEKVNGGRKKGWETNGKIVKAGSGGVK